jgi:hypothetical protein
MLVVSRDKSESCEVLLCDLIPLIEKDPAKLARILGAPFRVMVTDIRGQKVRLGFDCDTAIRVYRADLLEKINNAKA